MESKVIGLVVIGTISVMLMAFTVIYFILLYKRRELQNKLELEGLETKHQKDMLNASLHSQEQERNRLGTELHDSVGAMLSTIKMSLQLSKRTQSLENVDMTLNHLDETIEQVRSISHQMMPIVLKKYGIKNAIEDLFEKISNDELDASITHWTEIDLIEADQLFLFRIIQELSNNTIKHAQATKIALSTIDTGGKLLISYQDNGVGYPAHVLSKSEGMGLLNIENRAQKINAKVAFSNGKEGGSKVELVLKSSTD